MKRSKKEIKISSLLGKIPQGLSREEARAIVRVRFRNLAHKFHPDKAESPNINFINIYSSYQQALEKVDSEYEITHSEYVKNQFDNIRSLLVCL